MRGQSRVITDLMIMAKKIVEIETRILRSDIQEHSTEVLIFSGNTTIGIDKEKKCRSAGKFVHLLQQRICIGSVGMTRKTVFANTSGVVLQSYLPY